jgi:hypothetical protein
MFLKNITVGDVMFGELDNFMKSYDYGDIPLVYTRVYPKVPGQYL